MVDFDAGEKEMRGAISSEPHDEARVTILLTLLQRQGRKGTGKYNHQVIHSRRNKMDPLIRLALMLLLFHGNQMTEATLTERDNLYETVFKNYSKKTLPVLNHNDTVEVNFSISIISLNRFDEISGELSMSVLLPFSWTEERISWNPANFGGITSLLVLPEDIWRPQIYIIQSADKLQEITNKSTLVRVFHNGSVTWTTADVLKVTCSVDVTYFPFDNQTCLIMIHGWMYHKSELILTTPSNQLASDYYTQNSLWELMPSDIAEIPVTNYRMPPIVQLNLRLKRRNIFFIVYLIIPIILLAIINNLVFLMPANSGERTSVAITTFLSFVVYMEIVNDNVPESSSPMSYMYFYLLGLLIYSSTILFLCIISLRIYSKDGPVPLLVKTLTFYMGFKCFKQQNTMPLKVFPVKPMNVKSAKENDLDITDVDSINANATSEPYSNGGDHDDITWNTVGKIFDGYCTGSLYLFFVIFTVNTLISLYIKEGL